MFAAGFGVISGIGAVTGYAGFESSGDTAWAVVFEDEGSLAGGDTFAVERAEAFQGQAGTTDGTGLVPLFLVDRWPVANARMFFVAETRPSQISTHGDATPASPVFMAPADTPPAGDSGDAVRYTISEREKLITLFREIARRDIDVQNTKRPSTITEYHKALEAHLGRTDWDMDLRALAAWLEEVICQINVRMCRKDHDGSDVLVKLALRGYKRAFDVLLEAAQRDGTFGNFHSLALAALTGEPRSFAAITEGASSGHLNAIHALAALCRHHPHFSPQTQRVMLAARRALASLDLKPIVAEAIGGNEDAVHLLEVIVPYVPRVSDLLNRVATEAQDLKVKGVAERAYFKHAGPSFLSPLVEAARNGHVDSITALIKMVEARNPYARPILENILNTSLNLDVIAEISRRLRESRVEPPSTRGMILLV